MESNGLQRITVKVAGNVFPLEVVPSEEEFYRIAAEILNRKLEYYEKAYPALNRSKLLSMVAYDIAVGFLRYTNSNDLTDAISELKGLV